MPLGVIVNSICVLTGGILGGMFGKKLPKHIVDTLPNIFGVSAMSMGISLIVKVSSLSAVILALIVGALVGECLHIESNISNGLKKLLLKNDGSSGEHQIEFMSTLISMIVLFGFSGTGVFGALNSGFSGDHSILFAKSILDFFTAIIFGATLGYAICITAIPQLTVGLILFYCSTLLLPLLSEVMINDFKACGGIITLAVGLKMAKIKHYNVLNLIPALIFVMPFSYLWSCIPF